MKKVIRWSVIGILVGVFSPYIIIAILNFVNSWLNSWKFNW